MTKPLDREAIARAMQKASWIAANGTPDQRAGRFMPVPDQPGRNTIAGKPGK